MTELIINNTQVDLAPDVEIPLNFQASSAVDIGEVLSNYTNSFDLPATDNNLALLDNAQMVASNSRVPYKSVFAKLLINGRELFGVSRVVILEIGKETIRIAFIGGAKGAGVFKGSIRDLDFSALNFTFTSANCAARANNSTDVVWTPVNYGVDFIDTGVDIYYTNPAVYLKRIFTQIFSEAQVSLVVLYQTSTLFDRIVLPITQLVAVVTPGNPGSNAGQAFKANLLVNAVQIGNNPVIFPNVVSGNTAGGYNPATGIYVNPKASRYNFLIYLKFTVTTGTDLRIIIGQPGSSFLFYEFYTSSNISTVYEKTISLMGIEATFPLTNCFITFEGRNPTLYASSYWEVQILEDPYEGDTIDIAASLPDIAQADLFEEVAKMTNLIVSTREGVTSIMAFDRLSVSEQIDLSDRLDTRSKEDILFQSRFGQSTSFRYSNDAFAPSTTAGDAVVKFDNDILRPEATAIKLLFSGAVDGAISSIYSILIPLYELTQGLGPGTAGRSGGASSVTIAFSQSHRLAPGAYIFIEELGSMYYVLTAPSTSTVTVAGPPGSTPLPNFAGSSWNRVTIKPRSLVPRIAFAEVNSLVTNITYYGRVSNAPVTLCKILSFTGQGTEGLTWKKLLRAYFLLWLGNMERYQLVRAMFKLNDDDVYQFDFTRSAYVAKYGSRFYVEKISQYTGPDDTTEMSLFALAESLDPNKITDL